MFCLDDADAKPLIVKKGVIEYNNVNFHYENSAPIFKSMNATIKAGEKVRLVVLSGSGKSTFVNLILRLFDVQSGAILIDDQNINAVTQDLPHENIARRV